MYLLNPAFQLGFGLLGCLAGIEECGEFFAQDVGLVQLGGESTTIRLAADRKRRLLRGRGSGDRLALPRVWFRGAR